MLPTLEGKPVRVVVRASLGPHLAATSIPRRIIYLDRDVLRVRGDFERIVVHELFHFVWVRLGNQTRWEWEALLAAEVQAKVPGELGWSSEWRKTKLRSKDVSSRTPAWRRYVCESFCDTAARVYAGLKRHEEFTLPSPPLLRRSAWLQNLATPGLRL